jgi:hypothetical protein
MLALIEDTRLLTISATFSCGVVVDVVTGVTYEKLVASSLINKWSYTQQC